MTWGSYHGWIWFAIESHLAVICASAPALKIFFKQVLNVSSFASSFRSKTLGTAGDTLNSKGTGSTTLDRYREKHGNRLNHITVDTEISTTYGGKDKPFTIFSSQERLSGSFQDSQYMENGYEMRDIEAGRLPNEDRGAIGIAHGGETFFHDADSE